MSSSSVRTAIKTFLATEFTSEKILDLTGHYEVLRDALTDAGIDPDGPWIGLEFIPGDEQPITVGATNQSGKYRETGAIYIHTVDIAKLGVSDSILSRAEAIRDKLRGQRISGVVIDSLTPPNFGAGAALNFEDGFMSCSCIAEYTFDVDL